jgi:hypothetical protein
MRASDAASSSATGGVITAAGEARMVGRLLSAFWTEGHMSLMRNPITHFSPAEAWFYAKEHSLLRQEVPPALLQRLEVSSMVPGERNSTYTSVQLFNQSKNLLAFKARCGAMTTSYFEVLLNMKGSLKERLRNLPSCIEERNILLMSTSIGSSEASYARGKTEAEDVLIRTLYKVGLRSMTLMKLTKNPVKPIAADLVKNIRAFDPSEHLNYTDESDSEPSRTVLEWKAYSDATGITADR